MSSFSWNDYLELARELSTGSLSGQFPEARFRSAISRAYYSQFINARGIFGYPYQGHGELIKTLETHPDNRILLLGNDMKTLMELRHKADYEENINDPIGDSELAILIAEDIAVRLSILGPIYQNK